jgi:Flp pilus assembly pilin Flp
MPGFSSDLWNDDRGITSVEYALLLSFVAAGLK